MVSGRICLHTHIHSTHTHTYQNAGNHIVHICSLKPVMFLLCYAIWLDSQTHQSTRNICMWCENRTHNFSPFEMRREWSTDIALRIATNNVVWPQEKEKRTIYGRNCDNRTSYPASFEPFVALWAINGQESWSGSFNSVSTRLMVVTIGLCPLIAKIWLTQVL